MIKLIAFDWNGTLLSDTQMTLKAENKAILAVKGKPISLNKFRQTFDIPIIKYWKTLGYSDIFLKKHLNTIEEVFHLNYEIFANQARTRAGSKEVLDWLEKQKIQRVIYSNHNIPNIERRLKRLKIKPLINTVLARHLGDHSQLHERSKDKKLFDYIKQQKFKPHEVISVGDTEEEIEIGKKYGYYTVAITGGYNTTPRLKKHHPDFLIHNMLELKGIVKKLNRSCIK